MLSCISCIVEERVRILFLTILQRERYRLSDAAIEAAERKRECCFNGLESRKDALFAFSPEGPLVTPSGCRIDSIEGVEEHARHGGAAVGGGIGFEKGRGSFLL